MILALSVIGVGVGFLICMGLTLFIVRREMRQEARRADEVQWRTRVGGLEFDVARLKRKEPQ